MNSDGDSESAFLKMQGIYWKAKQSFQKFRGETDCYIIASDKDLDLRLQLLQALDESCSHLTNILITYQSTVSRLIRAEDNFGITLQDFGLRDSTEGGKLLCNCGKAISFSAKHKVPLKTPLTKLFGALKTFQFRAIIDVFQTVTKMEKSRNSYRSSLMWIKDVTNNLDPENLKKLKKYRKVQDRVKKMKNQYDCQKLKAMEKIDLLLLSRCNLIFSQILASYKNSFCEMCRSTISALESVIITIPYTRTYSFKTLKHLNNIKSERATNSHVSLENNRKEKDKSKQNDRESKVMKKKRKLRKRYSRKSMKPDYLTPINESCYEDFVKRTGKSKNFPLVDVEEEYGAIKNNLQKTDFECLLNFVYSKDLLQLEGKSDFYPISNSSKSCQNDFDGELQKTLDLFDPLAAKADEDEEANLDFWLIAKNLSFTNCEPFDTIPKKEQIDLQSLPTSDCQHSRSLTFSELASLISEFDPYHEGKNTDNSDDFI